MCILDREFVNSDYCWIRDWVWVIGIYFDLLRARKSFNSLESIWINVEASKEYFEFYVSYLFFFLFLQNERIKIKKIRCLLSEKLVKLAQNHSIRTAHNQWAFSFSRRKAHDVSRLSRQRSVMNVRSLGEQAGDGNSFKRRRGLQTRPV